MNHRPRFRSPISRTWILAATAVIAVMLGGGAAMFLALRSVQDTQYAAEQRSLARDRAVIRELQRTARIEHAAAAGSCYRVNYGRWLDNRSAHARWVTDQRFAHLIIHAPATRHQSRSQRAMALGFAQLELVQATTEQFRPLTDCHAALVSPETYKPPSAVPFSQALRIPRYVYELAHQPLNPQQGRY